MPVQMHSQGQDRCVLTCTECKQRVETGWHCPGCEDYDLCINCYNTKGHTHEMVKVGLGLDEEAKEGDEGGTRGSCGSGASGSCGARPSIQRCILCRYHAKQCQENPCPIPYCLNIKQKLRQQEIQSRRQHPSSCTGGCHHPLPHRASAVSAFPPSVPPAPPTLHPRTPWTPQPSTLPQPSSVSMSPAGFSSMARTQPPPVCTGKPTNQMPAPLPLPGPPAAMEAPGRWHVRRSSGSICTG
uniref:histone acetyltransferase n=1 Tax=Myotis myotis TaxID=51298 RepID=A0A7J7XIF2_MYOMY|nr:hypothetical protein mMyoMyo1_011692 [Myotis myotis]